nr:disease resistance protein rps2 [Quercus suber]
MNPNPLELKSSPPTVIRQIQGPVPPPLRVSEDSHKIKKSSRRRPPVITYQTSTTNFRPMVQSVTGYSSASYSGDGDLVPVARLASIVKTNPSKIDRDRANSTNTTTAILKEESVGVVVEILRQTSTHPGWPEPSTLPSIPDGFFSLAARLPSIVKASPSKRDGDRSDSTNTTTAMLEEEVAEILSNASTHPGVLSPSPSTLLPIPDGVFSPVIEPQSYLVKHELSPLWHNAFMASTSGLFSAPLISPSPSCMDLFNLFYAVLNAKTDISEELIKKGGDLAEQQPRRSLFPEMLESSYLPLWSERKGGMEAEPAKETDLMELTVEEGMDSESQACKEQELGNAAYTKNDLDTAIAHYTKVVELDDGHISCLMNRAVAYLAMEQKALSEHHNPDTLKKLNDAEKAKRELEQQEYFDTKLADEEHEKEEKSEKQILSEPHGMVFDVEAVKMTDSGEQNRPEIEEIGNVASHTRQPEVIQVEEMQPQALSTLKPQGVVFDDEAVKILKPSGQMEFQIEDNDVEPEASEQHGLFITQGGLVFTKPTKDEDWKHAKEIYLMDNELSVLPENPRCLNLSALFLPRNYKLRVIPPSFFDYMPTLQILNLSRTGIKSLPDSLFQLVSLERLFLNDCHRLMMLSPKVGDLEKLEVLDLEGAKIMNLPKEIKKLTNLICLEVSFYGYTGNGRSSMQSNAVVPCGVICSLSQLEELNIDVNPDDVRHATVKKLSDFGTRNMMQIKCCVVGECNEVQMIIDTADAYGEDGISEIVSESHDAERIFLGSLEYLYIYYMKSLRSIWEGPVPQNSLYLLKSLTLRTCPELTTIFTQELLDNLCSLEELKVEDCPSIKSIVSCKIPAEHRTSYFLPDLKKISLHYMLGLVSISSGLHIAPKLEWLSFYNCPSLSNPLINEVSSHDLKKIKGERSWWEALEWSNGRPDYLDEIFVPIDIWDC